MASGSDPVRIPGTSLVHGVPQTTGPLASGKELPVSGQPSPAGRRATTAHRPVAASDVHAQVALLNKFLNDSGRPDQFRVDPQSDSKLIQEINPANGEVIGEYPAIAFPALAKSLGISGAVIDEHA